MANMAPRIGLAARRLLLPLLAWGAVSACGASEGTAVDRGKVLTEGASGSVRTVAVREAVEIRLRAQPGTGFSWVPSGSSRGVISVDPVAPPGSMPGGWELQQFRFSASQPGTYRVTFSYSQPWDGGIKGARSLSFTFEVR